MIAGIDAGPALGEYVAVVGGGAVMAGMLAGGVVGLQRWKKRRPKGKAHWYQVWREPDEKLWRRVFRRLS